MDFLLAVCIFTDKLHLITHTVDGEITGFCQRLKDIDLLIVDGEHARMGHLTEDRDLIANYTYRDNWVLGSIEIGDQLVVNHLFAGSLIKRLPVLLCSLTDRQIGVVVI